jgi:hypothetical protein
LARKKNKDFALKVYRNYLKIDDAEILEVLYQTYVLGVIKPKPSPNTEGLQKSIDFIANTNPRLRGVNAANFIDDSLIGELEQEGFFTRLYR